MYFFQFEAAETALKADNWSLFRAWMEQHPDADLWIKHFEDHPNGLKGAVLNWYRANMNPDKQVAADPLPNVRQPVLIVYSMNDAYIGPEQMATGNQFIDGPITMKRIDGAGHFVARNAPEEFNATVIEFLKKHSDS